MKHKSVLLKPSIDHLCIKPNHWYIDATFGAGGHTSEIIKKSGRAIGFDWDKEVIALGKKKFAKNIEAQQLILVHESFAQVAVIVQEFLDQKKITVPSAIIFDFGTNSDQLTDHQRGFSFQKDGPLDMRMDERKTVTALDIIRLVPEKQLAKMFVDFGGESESKNIAQAIKKYAPSSTAELTELIIKTKKKKTSLHPATKVFQALRIAVNSEIDEINQTLSEVIKIKNTGFRVVTISFHEGEDRPVKQAMTSWQEKGLGFKINKKPLIPDQEEINQNPNARSAKMRVFEFI